MKVYGYMILTFLICLGCYGKETFALESQNLNDYRAGNLEEKHKS